MRGITNSHSLFGHKVVELFFGDKTVLVVICSLDHILKGVVILHLAQILGDSSQVLQGDESGSSSIEGDEDFVNFLPGFILRRSGGHHAKEFVKLQLSAAVLVDFGDHVPDGFGLCFDTECVNGFLEF